MLGDIVSLRSAIFPLSVVIASIPITYIDEIQNINHLVNSNRRFDFYIKHETIFHTKLPSPFQYGLLVYTELKVDGFLADAHELP